MNKADISSNTTPKITKRLGLSSSVPRINSKRFRTATPDSSVTSVEHEVTQTEKSEQKTIPITFCVITPDSSPSVPSFQCKDEANPSATPKQPIREVSDSAKSRTACSTPTAIAAISRYKLTLCKATNEKMTHKRALLQQTKSPTEPKRLKLEQETDNLNAHIEEPNSIAINERGYLKPTSDERREELISESSSETAALQQEIDEIEKKIAKAKFYRRETSEMQALIQIWREAGLKTIEQMQEQLLHMQDVTEILGSYGIDPGLFELPE